MERELSQLQKSSSFLALTNDVICTAMSHAMRLVSHSSASKQMVNTEEKCLPKTKSALKFEIHAPADKQYLPEISLDDVCWHDNIDDCWIIVYDRVFDITNFLQEHPGGEEILLEHAGRDATIAFKGVGHSREALRVLDKYLVGILPDTERIYNNGGKKVFGMLTTGLSIAS